MTSILIKIPGIFLALLIALPAWLIGKAFPIIGAPVLGIFFGMLLAFWNRPVIFEPGIRYTSKKILQYSIILLGFDMNLYSIFRVGGQTLSLMVFTLTITFLVAWGAGKLLKIDGRTKTLIAVGTAICGGSAIAATAPVIQADDDEIVGAISTIFLFNIIAAFLFPAIGHMLAMPDHTFGLWAGTAINDTSSVVAAGYTFSTEAGNLAVIVKLTRTLMIVPITLILAIYTSKNKMQEEPSANYSLIKIFPWFVIGFVMASVANTFLPIADSITSALSQTGRFAIIMAMSAIGLNTNIVKLVKSGIRPIFLGLICWVALSLSSLAVQHLLGL